LECFDRVFEPYHDRLSDAGILTVGCCCRRHIHKNASFLPTPGSPASASKSSTYKYFSTNGMKKGTHMLSLGTLTSAIYPYQAGIHNQSVDNTTWKEHATAQQSTQAPFPRTLKQNTNPQAPPSDTLRCYTAISPAGPSPNSHHTPPPKGMARSSLRPRVPLPPSSEPQYLRKRRQRGRASHSESVYSGGTPGELQVGLEPKPNLHRSRGGLAEEVLGWRVRVPRLLRPHFPQRTS
jgi:hypothetical protein